MSGIYNIRSNAPKMQRASSVGVKKPIRSVQRFLANCNLFGCKNSIGAQGGISDRIIRSNNSSDRILRGFSGFVRLPAFDLELGGKNALIQVELEVRIGLKEKKQSDIVEVDAKFIARPVLDGKLDDKKNDRTHRLVFNHIKQANSYIENMGASELLSELTKKNAGLRDIFALFNHTVETARAQAEKKLISVFGAINSEQMRILSEHFAP